MSAPPIFIISGVPGSGKSTLARALLQRFKLGLHIPVDELREFVVSGIAHPVPTWTDETERQFALARVTAADMARRYASAGFAVAIDDVLVSSRRELDLLKLLEGLEVHLILLRPPVEIALRRNRARSNKNFDTSILEEAIRRLDQVLEGIDFDNSDWIVINNGAQTPEQTANQICGAMGMKAGE